MNPVDQPAHDREMRARDRVKSLPKSREIRSGSGKEWKDAKIDALFPATFVWLIC